ncbi:hypothetical protein BJY52DRAFT_1232177 [Lactarius psammicola]|nr:hypothetical protein BJY52DRAFT_1232177 [Lactarius psammicola]
MHPTQHPTDSQQQVSMDYPLTPPHAIAPHPGYLPHGVPYPPMPLGPMAPYLPTAQGYGQQYQVWPTYAPYFTHSTTPMPNVAPMPVPLHAASGMGGPMSMPPPATPVRGPHRIPKRYVNSQCGPGVWEFDVSVVLSEAKIQLAFRVSGVSGKLSYLNNEADWESALNSVNTKITTARKNAVSLEVRNIAKLSSKVSKASSARGKCRPQDNVFMGKKMSLNEATIYTPPNIKGFNQSSTKKPHHSRGTPEVHVAVNIASPVPATGASVTSVVSNTHQDDCRPTTIFNITHPTPLATNHLNPPVRMLLELMDLHDLALDFKYIDLESELVEFSMKGVMDVYKMPQVLLASFGCLGDRKSKGRLLKEESRDVIIVWSSDEDEDEEGEQGTQGMDDKNRLPPY